MYPILFFITLIRCLVSASEQLHPLSDAFIDLINKEGKWKAGRNFHPDISMEHILSLLGMKIPAVRGLNVPIVSHEVELIRNLPESFDPRDKWPNCPTLNEIRDQGSCGSCWAFGATETWTDRVCIYSNGTKNFHFSAEDVLSCSGGGGCDGGGIDETWQYWIDVGVVSGGNYESEQGCKPYTIPKCQHDPTTAVTGIRANCTDPMPTPACMHKCRDGYTTSYEKDRRRGKNYYKVSGEDNIKAELFINGPVEGGFDVYADFIHYKSGIYEHLHGDKLGGHAIKIMGWGVEDGKKYWLVANSWNTNWGNKGYFKMRRGADECNIEEAIVAGEPALEDY